MAAQQHPELQSNPTSSGLQAETKQSLLRLFDAVYSEGNLGVTEEVVGAKARGYCAGTDKSYQGASGLKTHAARLRATFPGLTVEIVEVRSANDGFTASLTATGRFERDFGGVRPTCQLGAAGEEPGGPKVIVDGVLEGTMAGGRFTELAFDWDFEALRAQG